LIFINDLPNVLSHSKPLLFADDTKIYSNINSIDDCRLLQKDLDSLCNWCQKWKLDFNVLKCKILSVTKCKSPTIFDYTINGKSLERVHTFRDLGILIEENLSWNSHINNIISTANRVMGLIKRTVGNRAPVNVKLQLYISLVRSNLECNTQVWNGLTKCNRTKLERVQRAATRYILKYPNMNYTERLDKLKLLPLSLRRDMLDVRFFYKCLNGYNTLNVNEFVNFTCNNIVNTRSSHDPNLIRPACCKTLTFKNAFFNRISHSWNALPLSIRSCNTINSFSYQIKKYFLALSSHFNPDCCCCLYVKCPCLQNTELVNS
jgi:hypothetical protein